LLKISFPLARIINFFDDKETFKILHDLNSKEKVSLDESLCYMKDKILDYANGIDNIRNKIQEVDD
ncbi:unnamed protein product, partial [marine sediment metagenome]